MSLKRRDWIAWALLLAAVLCWVFGQRMLAGWLGVAPETTAPAGTYPANTSHPMQETMYPTFSPGEMHMEVNDVSGNTGTNHGWGFTLSFVGVLFGITGIFVLFQKVPLLGPDLILLLPTALVWIRSRIYVTLPIEILLLFLILFGVRELWGWTVAKWNVGWCLCLRLANRCERQQTALVSYGCWIMVSCGVIGLAYMLGVFVYLPSFLPMVGAGITLLLVLGCLWRYGTEVHHFEQQLARFQDGQTIVPTDGAFGDAERKLLDIQQQHEEAIQAAVTSERFKVELISNVSHDLRTPLTAILGYSELLGKEVLTAEGREQLRRLNQKAGYMSDLVESLFELTKVSSGMVEAKKQEIDLIRLLEQTIGLYDDQLTDAGLVVRRSYCAESLSVVTDGARMHQVFANLLGNAIKYALPGTRIYLEVKENADFFSVRMMNTASYEMDFEPDEILQRFARGDKARSTKGSGLGLAIAQTYTESVGGTFRVKVDGDQFSAIVELPKTDRNL